MFDGFPMSKKGEPGRALWLGIWASFFGGLLGGVFLIGTTEPLASLALQFGPWEYFSLFVFALSMVAGLTGASLVKRSEERRVGKAGRAGWSQCGCRKHEDETR